MISEEVRTLINKYGQGHILKHYDAGDLSEKEKIEFEDQVNCYLGDWGLQISKIDFARLQKIFEVSVAQTEESSADSHLEPMDNVFVNGMYWCLDHHFWKDVSFWKGGMYKSDLR